VDPGEVVRDGTASSALEVKARISHRDWAARIACTDRSTSSAVVCQDVTEIRMATRPP
jgi:hypothetical protein